MTITSPVFCLVLNLTDVHFQGELEHFSHVGEQKIKCRPIRTRELADIRFQDKPYVDIGYKSTTNQNQRVTKRY